MRAFMHTHAETRVQVQRRRAETRRCAIECSLRSRVACRRGMLVASRYTLSTAVARLSVTSQRMRVIVSLSGASKDSEVLPRTRSDGCTSIRVSMLTAYEYRRRNAILHA